MKFGELSLLAGLVLSLLFIHLQETSATTTWQFCSKHTNCEVALTYRSWAGSKKSQCKLLQADINTAVLSLQIPRCRGRSAKMGRHISSQK